MGRCADAPCDFLHQERPRHSWVETKRLGRLASHGCVRLAPENARTLFALIKEKGLENTQIVLNGETPSSEAQVASPALPKQQIKAPKASAADVADANSAKSPRNQMLQPKIGIAARKSVNDKDLSASVKKPMALKETPAMRKTASRSRSKPILVGTPARSSSASPRLANAAYAANVYGALARNKPRSVGASGSVTVSFAIGAKGSLRNALVARSSGKAPLDQAALAIIRRSAPSPRLAPSRVI